MDNCGRRNRCRRVAAVASYEYAYALVRAHVETGWTARLVPLTVDGLIYASSMGASRLRATQGAVARVGAVAARPGYRGDAGGERGAGLGHGPAGAAVAAWPAVALVGSHELCPMLTRLRARVPADLVDRRPSRINARAALDLDVLGAN